MTRIATWNLELAKASSPRMSAIQRRLNTVAPDIAVLTEARPDAIAHLGSLFDSGHHQGTPEGSRKVVVATKLPMKLVNDVGSVDLPPNNFVAVDVETATGPIRVIGIVVRWKQKEEYIKALPAALKANVTARTIVAGDFNLAIPNGRLSRELVAVLKDAGLTVITSGDHEALQAERALKDHIAVTGDLKASDLLVWPRRDADYLGGEKEVTDHAGTAIVVE